MLKWSSVEFDWCSRNNWVYGCHGGISQTQWTSGKHSRASFIGGPITELIRSLPTFLFLSINVFLVYWFKTLTSVTVTLTLSETCFPKMLHFIMTLVWYQWGYKICWVFFFFFANILSLAGRLLSMVGYWVPIHIKSSSANFQYLRVHFSERKRKSECATTTLSLLKSRRAESGQKCDSVTHRPGVSICSYVLRNMLLWTIRCLGVEPGVIDKHIEHVCKSESDGESSLVWWVYDFDCATCSHTTVCRISYEKLCTGFHAYSYIFNWWISAPTSGLGLGNKTRWLGSGKGRGWGYNFLGRRRGTPR